MANKVILEVENLTKYFNTPGGLLHAVDGVNFKVEEGRTLGIVGESGCGKSTTGRTILKLLEPTSGKIIFDGQDITGYSRKQMRSLRREMQMVFQDPFSSLDPRQTVSQLISEPIIEHKLLKTKSDIEKRTLKLMETVGLAERYINVYPHELDGCILGRWWRRLLRISCSRIRSTPTPRRCSQRFRCQWWARISPNAS